MNAHSALVCVIPEGPSSTGKVQRHAGNMVKSGESLHSREDKDVQDHFIQKRAQEEDHNGREAHEHHKAFKKPLGMPAAEGENLPTAQSQRAALSHSPCRSSRPAAWHVRTSLSSQRVGTLLSPPASIVAEL